MTVLAQALASFFLSIFFLIFLIGVFFLSTLLDGPEDSEKPGYSPCFQCLFFLVSEVAVNAQLMGGHLALVGCSE